MQGDEGVSCQEFYTEQLSRLGKYIPNSVSLRVHDSDLQRVKDARMEARELLQTLENPMSADFKSMFRIFPRGFDGVTVRYVYFLCLACCKICAQLIGNVSFLLRGLDTLCRYRLIHGFNDVTCVARREKQKPIRGRCSSKLPSCKLKNLFPNSKQTASQPQEKRKGKPSQPLRCATSRRAFQPLRSGQQSLLLVETYLCHCERIKPCG